MCVMLQQKKMYLEGEELKLIRKWLNRRMCKTSVFWTGIEIKTPN